jgi:hypothetical protein
LRPFTISKENALMRHVLAPVALALFFALSLASCAAPRYTTYKPPGGAPEWKVKAEKDMGGRVTIMINDTQALKGQYQIFGEEEVKGKYDGRDIAMILRKSYEGRGTVWECLLYAEGNQIGFFRW